MYELGEELKQYELECAQKIAIKKNELDENEIKNYLYKKGYLEESVKGVFEN